MTSKPPSHWLSLGTVFPGILWVRFVIAPAFPCLLPRKSYVDTPQQVEGGLLGAKTWRRYRLPLERMDCDPWRLCRPFSGSYFSSPLERQLLARLTMEPTMLVRDRQWILRFSVRFPERFLCSVLDWYWISIVCFVVPGTGTLDRLSLVFLWERWDQTGLLQPQRYHP